MSVSKKSSSLKGDESVSSLKKQITTLKRENTKLENNLDSLGRDMKDMKEEIDFLKDVLSDPIRYQEEYKEAYDKDPYEILRTFMHQNSSPRPSTTRSTRFDGTSSSYKKSRVLV